MIRWLLACLLFCVCPVWAGVVDDAEEVLKQIETDGPGLRQLRAEAPTQQPPQPYLPSVQGDSAPSTSPPARPKRPSRRGSSSAAIATGSEQAKDSMPARRMRNSKQRALSFGGLVLLLGLIALAAVLGRKLAAQGGSDD